MKLLTVIFFAAGERVEVYGTIEGDAYIAGGEVVIDGVIVGDLLVAGGDVRIAGEVLQDVRVMGGQVFVTGTVSGSVSAAAGDITLVESAQIDGSLVAAAGNIRSNAPVGSHTTLAGGVLSVANTIDGDLKASVGEMRVTSKAEVSGDVVYWSDQDASIDGAALIGGEVIRKTPRSYEFPADQWFQFFCARNTTCKTNSTTLNSSGWGNHDSFLPELHGTGIRHD